MQNNPSNDEVIEKYEETVKRSEKEKNGIKKQAEGFQKEQEDINLFTPVPFEQHDK